MTTIRPKDVVASVAPHEPGKAIRVKLTHKPTGISVERTEATYIDARDAALVDLEAQVEATERKAS